MTVAELINKLSQFDPEKPVVTADDWNIVSVEEKYGLVIISDAREEEEDEEE